MQKKKMGIWFLITAVIAVLGFIAPNLARSMFRSGALPEGTATTIVALSVPIAMIAIVVSISLLIALIFKK